MRKYSAAGAGTVHRSSRAGILLTSRDIWRLHIWRFLNESKVGSCIKIPFKSARPMHIDMCLLLLATKSALREKIVGSQRIETRNPLADLLSRGEAEAAGERSAVTVPVVAVVQEGDSGTAQSGTAAGAEGAGNSRKRKVSFIIHCLPHAKLVPSFIESKDVNPSFHIQVLNP